MKQSSGSSSTVPYDPATFRPLTYVGSTDAIANGSDSPSAYLERCLDVISA